MSSWLTGWSSEWIFYLEYDCLTLANFAYHSGLSYIHGGYAQIRWRLPIGFQIIPLLCLFGLVWLFPESPRWLVKVGRDEEARYILGRLRGETEADEGRAEVEFQEIKAVAALELSDAYPTSYLSMLFGRGGSNLHIGRRVQLVIWLQVIQEWVGIAGVTICTLSSSYFLGLSLLKTCRSDAPTIFRLSGFSANKSQWISGLNNIFYMVNRSPYTRRSPR